MAKLILMFKEKILTSYPLTQGGTLTIGRHPDNDIVLENLSVSAHHARIEYLDGEIVLTDLESTNGTRRNGQKVTSCKIIDRDVIIIGKHAIQADLADTMAVESGPTTRPEPAAGMDVHRTLPSQPEPASEKAPSDASMPVEDTPAGDHMSSPASGKPKSAHISFLSGGEGELPLSTKQISIGKNSDADIVVEGIWKLLLGGPAAIIIKQAGDYFLCYSGGWIKPKRNGSTIKGTVKLHHDDVVSVGPVTIQVQLGEAMAA